MRLLDDGLFVLEGGLNKRLGVLLPIDRTEGRVLLVVDGTALDIDWTLNILDIGVYGCHHPALIGQVDRTHLSSIHG